MGEVIQFPAENCLHQHYNLEVHGGAVFIFCANCGVDLRNEFEAWQFLHVLTMHIYRNNLSTNKQVEEIVKDALNKVIFEVEND